MKLTFDNTTIDLITTGQSYLATIGEQTFDVQILRAENGRLDLLIDGERVITYVSSENAKHWVTVDGQTSVLTRSSGAKRKSAGHDHTSGLVAPMPGLVRSVNVSEGEAVAKGQTLMVLEAMKMEIRIQAPYDGVIQKLLAKQGETVEREQVLIEFE